MTSMDICRRITEDFLRCSWPCVEATVKALGCFEEQRRDKVHLYNFKNDQKNDIAIDGTRFFLRTSVEYSNPQLTVEEVQGIIAARLIEVSGDYFHQKGLCAVEQIDVDQICELLKKAVGGGKIVPFLLNADDIEPDRYSMNPLKSSIVDSGQSAFPAATVKTEGLEVDRKFVEKYSGSLIAKGEVESVERHLKLDGNGSYMDMIDRVKYEQLETLSEYFGMNLCLNSLRMPVSTLQTETTNGLLHHIIREAHKNYESIECVYKCMGRSMKNLTTLLTVPHSTKGYGSKRAARGRIYFENTTQLKRAKVDYRTVLLYPNAMDPSDVSVAKAEDSFVVDGEKFMNYDFKELPSSPQFFLYTLASPEDAVMWHGIGAFGASELLKSYTTTRVTCAKDMLIKGLSEKFNVTIRMPLQFNLDPKCMWVHPVHRNIDASIGCVDKTDDLAQFGMKVEHLPTEKYIRQAE